MGPLSRALRCLLVAAVLLLGAAALGRTAVSQAQETVQIGRITIAGSNSDSFPSVQLQVYGMDGQGAPIDFAAEPLFLSHNNFPVDEVVFDGRVPVGTLTVFLIDVAGGITDPLPAIESAIRQYAGPGNMQEQLDYVAVYQNRAAGPQELLAPTPFHNGVGNLFITTPLTAEEGATSLYDAVIRMVELTPGLRPKPEMATSIVLISDGTDPGTSQATASDVPTRAAAAGIPIHTVIFDNPEVNREAALQYMRDIAGGSRGIATELGNAEGLASIWSRIAGFREHALVRYTVPEPASGTFPVELSLLNNRDTRAVADVTISTAAPQVVINLPRESRAITVPDLDEPVELQLSAAVSWLDGQARELTAARLLVNDVAAGDIPVDSLDSFTLPIANLVFGDNRLEVEATDSQGLTSKSAPVTLSVTQGEEVQLPEELQPSGSGFNPLWLLIPLILLAVAGLGYLLWRQTQQPRRAAVAPGTAAPVAPAGGRRRRRRPSEGYPPPGTPVEGVETVGEVDFMSTTAHEKPFVMAHLEVINAQTLMPEELTLGDLEVRVGRSPAQSQIAFRDDITVSRFHAVLRLEGNRYRVYDAGSTSGTFVNGRPVPEYGLQLSDGDEIQLGAVVLRYRQL